MKMYTKVFTATLMVLIPCINAEAIDREADSIEAFRVDWASYAHTEDFGLAITAESPVANSGGMWAVISELGGGQLSQSEGPSFDRLHLKLGLKRYLTDLTSLALSGGYAWYDGDDSFNIGQLTLSARQFLISTRAPVAPYVRVNGSLQFVDPSLASPARQTDSYDMSVIEALAGCEVRMPEGLAFVFETGLSESTSLSSSGTGFADGWLLRFAMQYDWF